MSGYPIPRSPLFQHTVGRTAFNIFQSLGYMSHNTAEEIPGEKVFAGDVELAKQRLLRSLTDFQDFQGTLHPHFAYGVLDKSEYAKAHVMHIADHLAPAERG